MNDILEKYNSVDRESLTERDLLVERLLKDGHINTSEAAILLKTIAINLTAETLELSTGAKIIGGSDFESTQY